MNKRPIIVFFMLAVGIALFLSPFASPSPDGLERVAEDKGFLHLAEGKGLVRGLMPDYAFPGIDNEALATSLAGFTGTLLTFVFLFCLAFLLARPKKQGKSRPEDLQRKDMPEQIK